MKRPLPTAAESAAILGRKRTRPQRRSSPPVGRTLRPFLKSVDEKIGQGPQALAARWTEIVGPELGARTEPAKLTRPRGGGPGTLELRVTPSAALMVQHQGQALLQRVNLFLGAGAVGKLRIVQGPVKPRAIRPAKGRTRTPPPLDAASEAELTASIDGVEPKLAAALLRLGRAVRASEPSR